MDRSVFVASDGKEIVCFHWPHASPAGVVQIAHGMGEHAERYDRVAARLNQAGWAVIASDHRGHGQTDPDALGDLGADGWNRVVADLYEINRFCAASYPGVPLVLLGHSMGSMLAQQYVYRHGRSLDALVLSGSPGFAPMSQSLLGRGVALVERRRLGPTSQSPVLQRLLFGGANKPFDGPEATGFEWLSRDAGEVAKYIDDPGCGFVIATGSLIDMYRGTNQASRPEAVARIPGTLPIFVFSGADDPVHGEQRNLQRMVSCYRDAGLEVHYRVYPSGRHEMFNETNRDEVMDDLIAWLEGAIGG